MTIVKIWKSIKLFKEFIHILIDVYVHDKKDINIDNKIYNTLRTIKVIHKLNKKENGYTTSGRKRNENVN